MSEAKYSYHTPVLLAQSVEALTLQPGEAYADLTYGGGGHSKEILKQLPDGARLFGFDQDANAERNAVNDPRFTFVRSNFRYLENFMRWHGMQEGIGGVLADLGVSSHQFDTAERGFSFRFDAELDMRMNNRDGKTAKDVINTYSEEQLGRMLNTYADLKRPRHIARQIAKHRAEEPINRIDQLVKCVSPLIEAKHMNKSMAQIFQAIRIEVNNEMDALIEMLRQTAHCIKPGGRLVVITYHSGEDKLVKNFMRTGNVHGQEEKDFYGNILRPFEPVNRKVIVPSTEEIETNPRARSAKLRIAERTVG